VKNPFTDFFWKIIFYVVVVIIMGSIMYGAFCIYKDYSVDAQKKGEKSWAYP